MAMEQTLKNVSSGPFSNPSALDLRPGVRLAIEVSWESSSSLYRSTYWDLLNSDSIVGGRIDIWLQPPDGRPEMVFQAITVSRETADIIIDGFILPALRRIVLLKGQDVDTVLWAVEKILKIERAR
jgi:hypothetical protein